MKVAHISAHVGGGVGAVLASLVESLVAVSSPEDEHAFFCLDCCVEVPDTIRSATRWVDCMASRSADLSRAILTYDVVLCHYWNNPLMADYLTSGSLPSCKLVFWVHNSGLEEPHVIPSYLLRSGASIVFSSQASLKSRNIVKSFEGSPELFHTISSVRSLRSFFALSRSPRENVSRQRLLYVGTVSASKMHHDSAKIFATLSREGFDVCVVGGPDENKLAADVAAEGGSVTVCGFQKNTLLLYEAADIFIYPLRRGHYGTGEQVILEAMASGLPVVAFDNPAESLLVEHGRSGLLASTVSQFLDYVHKIRTDRLLYESMSHEAIELVRLKCDPKVMTSSLLEVLRAQLARKPVTLNRQWPSAYADHGLIAFACHSFFDGLQGLPSGKDSESMSDAIFKKILPYLRNPSGLGSWTSATKGSPFHYLSHFPDSFGLKRLCGQIQQHGLSTST